MVHKPWVYQHHTWLVLSIIASSLCRYSTLTLHLSSQRSPSEMMLPLSAADELQNTNNQSRKQRKPETAAHVELTCSSHRMITLLSPIPMRSKNGNKRTDHFYFQIRLLLMKYFCKFYIPSSSECPFGFRLILRLCFCFSFPIRSGCISPLFFVGIEMQKKFT